MREDDRDDEDVTSWFALLQILVACILATLLVGRGIQYCETHSTPRFNIPDIPDNEMPMR